MGAAAIEDVRRRAEQLSVEDQLALIEHLIGRLRARRGPSRHRAAAPLSEMAADPQIRTELAAIDAEFRRCDADGLA